MNVIKTVVKNFCLCASVSFFLETLMPEKQKKAFKIICAAVIVFTAVQPFMKSDFSFDFDSLLPVDGFTDETNGALTGVQKAFEKEIYKKTEQILINEGITEYEIYISTEKNEYDNTVTLTEVTAVLGEKFKNKKETAYKLLEKEFKDVLKIEVKKDG